MPDQRNEQSPFEALGGEEKISELVDAFYRYIAAHEDVRHLFPEDLTHTAYKQKRFLTQFFGGPPLYTEEFGHPRLRARRMPFVISPVQAEAWLSCMERAMDDVHLSGDIRDYMMHRLRLTAHHMVNHPTPDKERSWPMNAKHRVTSHCDHELGICGISPEANEALPAKKPLEIYTFIDPLCAQCWSMEPILKKLKVEYGHYFRIRVLLAGKLNVWNACEAGKAKHTRPPVWVKGVSSSNMPYAGDIKLSDFHPYKASLAIKAAELQGPKAGHRFLRKLRETLFLQKQNITNEDVLKACANAAGLDVDAFIADLHSPSAAKALQCDVQTTNEMDVDTVPTFVFFNDNSEEAGIRIFGQYPFSIYVQLLEDMLGFVPVKATPPTLEGLLQTYGFLATAEVAMVLDLSSEEAEKKLKTLMLQQKVEAVPYEYGTFWKWLM